MCPDLETLSLSVILPNTDSGLFLPVQASQIVAHIMHETKLHIKYCESFNISKSEMEATEEKQGTCPPSPPSHIPPFSSLS